MDANQEVSSSDEEKRGKSWAGDGGGALSRASCRGLGGRELVARALGPQNVTQKSSKGALISVRTLRTQGRCLGTTSPSDILEVIPFHPPSCPLRIASQCALTIGVVVTSTTSILQIYKASLSVQFVWRSCVNIARPSSRSSNVSSIWQYRWGLVRSLRYIDIPCYPKAELIQTHELFTTASDSVRSVLTKS